MLLLKHDIMGTNFNTGQTSCAGVLLHEKYAVFQINRIFRTVFGTHSALVAKMDAIVTGGGEPPLDP
jgi:hypothetical protein